MATNASWRLAATLVRVAVGLVSVPLFTRLLGMSQWGLLALFQAATSPLALLDMGLGAAAVKYVAEYTARGENDRAVKVFHTTLLFNLVMGLVGALLVAGAAPWLAHSLFAIPAAEAGRAVTGFRIMALSWLVGVLTASAASVLAAHQRYDASSRLATVAVVVTAGSGLLVAALGGDIVAVLAAQTAVSALLGLAYLAAARSLLPGIARKPRWDAESFRRSFGFGLWQGVAVGGAMLSGWGDRYILGAFFVPATVGFYSVVNLLYTQMYTLFLEMGEVLFPAVSHLEGQGDLAGARRLTLLVAWTLATGFGIAGSVLAVVGGDFVQLWISPEASRAAAPTLRLLCAAGILGMPAIALFYYLLGIGRTRWDAASALVVGLTVVGLDLLLVPRLGMIGLGFGLIGGVLARWVILGAIWKAHFSREWSFGAFALHVFVPALVALGVLGLLDRLHALWAPRASWPWFVLEGAVALAASAGIQLGVAALLPGGRQRIRDVASSFRPVLDRIAGALPFRAA